MSVFTPPITINDGTADSTFSFRYQVPDKTGKLVIGEYFEPAAPMANQSKLLVRHDLSKLKTSKRSMISFGEQILVSDLIGRKPIVFTGTILYHPEHDLAHVKRVLNIGLNALKEPGAIDAFLQGQI